MNTERVLPLHRCCRGVAVAAAALLAASLLPACSDGDADFDTAASQADAKEDSSRARAPAMPPMAALVTPLLATDGTVLPGNPKAVPSNAAARTQQRH